MQSATITWPQNRIRSTSAGTSVAPTPRNKFILMDMSMVFPQGELSLICGKLGSGKTLLLLGVSFRFVLDGGSQLKIVRSASRGNGYFNWSSAMP